jgi:hypothetical protein
LLRGLHGPEALQHGLAGLVQIGAVVPVELRMPAIVDLREGVVRGLDLLRFGHLLVHPPGTLLVHLVHELHH